MTAPMHDFRQTRVLFLDIDGVLNGHDWDEDAQSNQIRKGCVKQLSRIILATGCRIVLSSTWRYMILKGAMTTLGFEYLLRTHGACGVRIVGTTREDIDQTTDERGRQIADWLKSNGPVMSYVVIDDEDFGIRKLHPAVITDGACGLSESDANMAIELLTPSRPGGRSEM